MSRKSRLSHINMTVREFKRSKREDWTFMRSWMRSFRFGVAYVRNTADFDPDDQLAKRVAKFLKQYDKLDRELKEWWKHA